MEPREVRTATKAQTADLAAAALEKTLGRAVRRVKYLGGGSFGWAYFAETDGIPGGAVMKACRTAGAAQREARELRLLGEDTLIPVPEVYFTFSATPEIPMDFICMQKMAGTDCFTHAGKLLCSKAKKAAFADRVTDAVRHWHRRENDRFGLIENPAFADWFDYYRPFAAEVLGQARDLTAEKNLPVSALEAMERAWAAFDGIFSEPVKTAALIHGDMNVMNVLSDRHLNPTAIIDPLESKWADPEYELFQFRNLTGDRFGLYETYKKKYPVSEKCDLKTAFYGLYHEVYAYVLSGVRVDFILRPLIRRMNEELTKAGIP